MTCIAYLQPTGRRRRQQAINPRLGLVAFERCISAQEVAEATFSEEGLLNFACRHQLSLDWLILGDLRGLSFQERDAP